MALVGVTLIYMSELRQGDAEDILLAHVTKEDHAEALVGFDPAFRILKAFTFAAGEGHEGKEVVQLSREAMLGFLGHGHPHSAVWFMETCAAFEEATGEKATTGPVGYTDKMVELVAEAIWEERQRREPSGDIPDDWVHPGDLPEGSVEPPRERESWEFVVYAGKWAGDVDDVRAEARAALTALGGH
jgi:hypothetical protein